MKVIYSFNKVGYEAEQWERELACASSGSDEFIPFNHGNYIDINHILNAWQLDAAYRSRDAGLLRLYDAFAALVRDTDADAVIVCNCPPYHPDYLLSLPTYRVLYSSDDPDSTYRRNIPYLHAYHHVLYCDPAHSAEVDMQDKMRQCGMVNADLVPLGVMDFEFRPDRTELDLFSQLRDVDVIYIGSCFRQKLPLLAHVCRALGSTFRLHGMFRVKHNLYFNARFLAGRWVGSVTFDERTALYQRAKLGFNIHWNEYGLGNQRLYHLPANGVMQLSDCGNHLHHFFEPGREAVPYSDAAELTDLIHRYLADDEARREIAHAAYRRTMRQYRFVDVTRGLVPIIQRGMQRLASTGRLPDLPALSRPSASAVHKPLTVSI